MSARTQIRAEVSTARCAGDRLRGVRIGTSLGPPGDALSGHKESGGTGEREGGAPFRPLPGAVTRLMGSRWVCGRGSRQSFHGSPSMAGEFHFIRLATLYREV